MSLQKSIYSKEKEKRIMTRMKIAEVMALVATVVAIIGLVLLSKKANGANTVMGIGFILSIATYICGGFGTAVKMSWNVAKWGWVFFPFPISVLAFVVTLGFGVYAFLFLPVIPVTKAFVAKKNELGE